MNPFKHYILTALVGMAALTVAMAATYSAFGTSIAALAPGNALLAVFGPVLALFTHMSVFLFFPLATPLAVLLILAVKIEQARAIALLGFAAAWLAMGWYLRSLF